MGTSNGRESCGRCSFTTLVDAVEAADSEEAETDSTDDDSAAGSARDPYAGERIELSERELRIANAPAILAGRLKRRLDAAAHRFVYGE